jgi:TetR/AcrR family transcriptional regulator, multidrug resistance operon repressor
MKPKDDEKLQAIAEATFALVEKVGLSGLTMADIARAAGIATGTLYVYYSSKEELINDLYEKSKTAFASRLTKALDARLPFRSRARLLWRSGMKDRLDNYAETVFQQQYVNSQWCSQSNRVLSSNVMKEWLDFIVEGKKQEILKDAPSSLMSALFMGSVRETGELIRKKTIKPSEEVLDIAFALCWDALKA